MHTKLTVEYQQLRAKLYKSRCIDDYYTFIENIVLTSYFSLEFTPAASHFDLPYEEICQQCKMRFITILGLLVMWWHFVRLYFINLCNSIGTRFRTFCQQICLSVCVIHIVYCITIYVVDTDGINSRFELNEKKNQLSKIEVMILLHKHKQYECSRGDLLYWYSLYSG